MILTEMQSTGKTTLCDALAKKLGLKGSAYVTEVARDVMRSHGFTRDHISQLEMQEAIMVAHVEREDEGRGRHSIQLCDRSAVDAVVYAVMTASNDKDAETRKERLVSSSQFKNVLEIYRRSVVVLLMPVEAWLVDDGTRSLDNGVQCASIFKQVLNELGIAYREIGPEMRSVAERMVVVMGLAKL